MMPFLPLNLTQRAWRTFDAGHDLAERRGDRTFTATHLALGLLDDRHDMPAYVLQALGVPLDDFARELESELPAPRAPRSIQAARLWDPADNVFVEQAKREAQELDTVYYGAEHVLLALLRDQSTAAARLLARYRVCCGDVQAAVRWLYAAEPGASPPWKV